MLAFFTSNFYIDLKKYDKAEECVERANKLDTMYVPGWLNRGNICRETGRWDCAENFYNKAMNLNPGFASTYLNYAVLKAKLNDAPAATYYAEQAILKGLNFLEYYSTENFNQVNKTPEWKALMEKYFSKKLKE